MGGKNKTGTPNDATLVTYAKPFEVWDRDAFTSLVMAEAGIEGILEGVQAAFQAEETLKKMPEYNVEYCIETAFNVNDVAIKSYDIKKDDQVILTTIDADGGPDEPVPAKADPMAADRIQKEVVAKAVSFAEDVDRSESKLS